MHREDPVKPGRVIWFAGLELVDDEAVPSIEAARIPGDPSSARVVRQLSGTVDQLPGAF